MPIQFLICKTIYMSQLYNDLHPNKSLKHTGYKDEKTAINTIKLVKKRSLKYQFDVINTMYNRAKFHQHKTKNMELAMKIFKTWLKNYQSDNKFPFLDIKSIIKYEDLAGKYNIDTTFLNIYKKYNDKPYKLQYVLLDDNKPNGYDYWSYRNYILNKIYDKNKKLFNLNGTPTKYYLKLIMLAYSPEL